jgi:hypothetical protein
MSHPAIPTHAAVLDGWLGRQHQKRLPSARERTDDSQTRRLVPRGTGVQLKDACSLMPI